jgi:hypothetical protein
VAADDAEGSGRTTLFGERRAAGLAPLYIETALGVNSFGGQGDRLPLDFGVIESEAGDLFEDFVSNATLFANAGCFRKIKCKHGNAMCK